MMCFSINPKNYLIILLTMISSMALGQVTYRIALDDDKVTYHVFMKSANQYTGNPARIGSAQVTIVVPHATNKFVVGNLKGKSVTNSQTNSTTEMAWAITRVDAPNENKNGDYLSFGFNNSASPILFDIPANQDIEIFSFKNVGACTGIASLFDNTSDLFKSPNSQNTNPGNSISIAGFGFGNAYTGNVGSGVNCLNTTSDLKVTPSGASTITVGSNYSLNLAVSNIGAAASSGEYTLLTTLPAGVSYANSSGGSGWTCTSAVQANQTTTVTCKSSAVIATSQQNTVSLNVLGASSLVNNSTINMSGSISGGGDADVSNNNFTWSPTVINNAVVNLTASMNGIVSVLAGQQVSYSIDVSNIGSAASTGAYSISLTLPAGVQYNSFIGVGWSVSTSSQANGSTVLTAQSSTVINAGGNAGVLMITVTPSLSIANGSSIVFNGSVSGGGDNSPSNNNFTFNSNVINNSKPIFTVNVTGTTNVVAGNQTNITYNIQNTGTAPSSGIYFQTITLPAGLTYNSFTGNGWTVVPTALPNGTTTLAAQSSTVINAGGNATPLIINATVASTLTNNTVLSVLSTLTGGGSTGNVNGTFNITVSQAASPVLTATMTGTNPVTSGTATNLNVNLGNSGTGSTTEAITMTSTLPAGVTYNSFTGTGWSVVATPQANGTTLISATYNSTIAAGANTNPLVLNVTPTSSSSTSFTINSSVNGGGTSGSGNFTYNMQVSQATSPILTATMTGTNPTNSGTATNLNVNLSNSGNVNTSGTITMTTTLPAGIAYNSFTGNGWSVVATPQANGTTLITAKYNQNIASGANANLLVLNVTPTNSGNTNISLTINSSITGGNANTSSISYIMVVSPIQSANQKPDLTVMISGAGMLQTGSQGSYVIHVMNEGNASTNGVYSVTTIIPKGLIYISSMGTDWSCNATPQADGSTMVVCQTGNALNAGGKSGEIILKIAASSNMTTGKSFVLNAIVSGGGEIKMNNNIASVGISVYTFMNTILNYTINGNSIAINQPTNFSFIFNNSGTTSTSGIYQFHAFLPQGVTFNSVSGNGWACATTPQTNGISKLVCQSNNPLGGGQSNNFTINLTSTSSISNIINIFLNGDTTGGMQTKPIECVCN
jgi:uncharacterized repeat protein (TIGR01451 family)